MQQVFYPLNLSPPSAESCMHAIKQAFSHYFPLRERRDFCPSCVKDKVFPEFQTAIDHPDTAKPWVYELFFDEHINCVGTINNLKFWLPRTLETSILYSNKHFTFQVFEKYKSQNIGFWSPEETKALRQVFTRSLIGLVEHMDAAPLGPAIPNRIENSFQNIWPASFSLEAIIGSLIALRVDPHELFQYILNHSDERIDYFLAEIITVSIQPWWLGTLDDTLPTDLTNLGRASIFLDQNAMAAIFDVVSRQYLQDRLTKYNNDDNALLIEKLERALHYYDEEKAHIPSLLDLAKEKQNLRLLLSQA